MNKTFGQFIYFYLQWNERYEKWNACRENILKRMENETWNLTNFYDVAWKMAIRTKLVKWHHVSSTPISAWLRILVKYHLIVINRRLRLRITYEFVFIFHEHKWNFLIDPTVCVWEFPLIYSPKCYPHHPKNTAELQLEKHLRKQCD